jgi:hypothetical protein
MPVLAIRRQKKGALGRPIGGDLDREQGVSLVRHPSLHLDLVLAFRTECGLGEGGRRRVVAHGIYPVARGVAARIGEPSVDEDFVGVGMRSDEEGEALFRELRGQDEFLREFEEGLRGGSGFWQVTA